MLNSEVIHLYSAVSSCIHYCMQEEISSRFDSMAPLAAKVYVKLKKDLFDFLLLPGDRFTESEVAEVLQVSRTPVREALMQLQKEGFLQMKFRAGWQVKPFDFKYYQELYDLRIVLETAALSWWKTRRVPEDEAELQRLLAFWGVKPWERKLEGQLVAAEDEAFHRALVGLGGNHEAVRLHEDITEKIRLIRRLDFTNEDRLSVTYDEHHALLQVLQRGDYDLAIRDLEAHIASSRKTVENITILRLENARSLRYS